MIHRSFLGFTALALLVLAAGIGVPQLEAEPTELGPSAESQVIRITPQVSAASATSSGLASAGLVEIGTAGLSVDGNDTWTPSAIFNDGVDSTTLEVSVSQVSSELVYVTAGDVLDADTELPELVDLVVDELGPLIQLFDDGTNGDRISADGIYSRSGITASGSLQHDSGSHQRLATHVVAVNFPKPEFVGWNIATMPAGIAVIANAQRGSAPTTQLGTGLSASSHAVFLVGGTVLPGYPLVDTEEATNVCEGCRILIERFGDVFDFVLIQTATYVREQDPCGCDAFFKGTFNDVEGIGQSLFNNNIGPNTFQDGGDFNTFSDGRLQGVIYNKRIDGSPLAHEVMHRFTVDAALATGWSDGAGHYVANTDVTGIMDLAITDANGFLVNRPGDAGLNAVDYVSNGGVSFRLESRNGAWPATFHSMSLYLGGFRSASGVTPVQILNGSINLSDPDAIVPSSGTTTVAVSDVAAIEGPRTPSSVDSQKDFTIGTIVVSDQPFTEAEITFITLMLRHFESNRPYDGFGSPAFGPATLNVASVTTALPIVTEEPEDPVEELEDPVEEPTGAVLDLVSGGQFLFWNLGDTSAANVFETVKIAWLFNTASISWTSFIPSLGVTNFPLTAGATLWIVVDFATSIPLSNWPPS